MRMPGHAWKPPMLTKPKRPRRWRLYRPCWAKWSQIQNLKIEEDRCCKTPISLVPFRWLGVAFLGDADRGASQQRALEKMTQFKLGLDVTDRLTCWYCGRSTRSDPYDGRIRRTRPQPMAIKILVGTYQPMTMRCAKCLGDGSGSECLPLWRFWIRS